MAGQQLLVPPDALAPMAALEAALEADEQQRSAAHAGRLSRVLALLTECRRQQVELQTGPQLALLLNCSEHRAWDLICQAQLLDRLPGGLDVLASGC